MILRKRLSHSQRLKTSFSTLTPQLLHFLNLTNLNLSLFFFFLTNLNLKMEATEIAFEKGTTTHTAVGAFCWVLSVVE